MHIHNYKYTYILYTYTDANRKLKIEAQAIFLYPFTVYSLCQRKFVFCPFVDKETNGSYPFAYGQNRINGLNGLALLCKGDLLMNTLI
jgi:hypothetical protein